MFYSKLIIIKNNTTLYLLLLILINMNISYRFYTNRRLMIVNDDIIFILFYFKSIYLSF